MRDYPTLRLRNKSWKPECVWSFNMPWSLARDKILISMLKLQTHSGFHDLFMILICLRVQIW